MNNLIEVELKGIRALQAQLNNVAKVTDPSNVVDEVGAVLLNRIRTRFLAQTDPDGNKWPVSKAARKRTQSGKGGGTLFDTGLLWRSIQAIKKGESEVAIATDVFYGRFHQEGIGQEKRVFLGFSGEDVEITRLLINDRIAKALK